MSFSANKLLGTNQIEAKHKNFKMVMTSFTIFANLRLNRQKNIVNRFIMLELKFKNRKKTTVFY